MNFENKANIGRRDRPRLSTFNQLNEKYDHQRI